MKLNYYPDTDSLYIDLANALSVDSKEIAEGIVLDFDVDGNLVGIDIDGATKRLDLSEILMSNIPSQKYRVA